MLSKLLQVDGAGTTLDADLLDGISSAALQRRGTATTCAGGTKMTAIAVNGDVTCAADDTVPSGPAGGDLTGNYPAPQIAGNAVRTDEVLDGSLGMEDISLNALVSGTTFNNFVVAAQSCRMTVLSNISTAVAAGDLVIPRVTSETLPDGVVLQPYVVGADGDVVRIFCNATGVDASLSGPMQISFRRIR